MATLDEFCMVHATGAASAQRLHAVGCHTPSDLHRFTAGELSTLLAIEVDAAERLLGACAVAVDAEPEFEHASRFGALLRPERGVDLELDLCLRLAQAGVTSVADLARSSPLELARALGVDVGRLMRLVAWAEQWLEDRAAFGDGAPDRSGLDADAHEGGLRNAVLYPGRRRSERFSPAESAANSASGPDFGPRGDALELAKRRRAAGANSAPPGADRRARS